MTFDTSQHPLSEIFPADQPDAARLDAAREELVFRGIGEADAIRETISETAAAPETAAPGWFNRLRARKSQPAERTGRRSAQTGPAFAIKTDDDEEQLTWREKMLRWFASFSARAFGTSFIFHLVVLLLLSLILLTQAGQDRFSTLLSQPGEEELEFDDGLDTRIEMAGADHEVIELPQLQRNETTENLIREPNVTGQLDSLIAAAIGSGEGNSEGSGLKFSLPKGGNAVNKGSFTAWTVPKDPAPGEDYLIVIQIRLPKKVRRYPRRDLSGMVIGTDDYRQPIPDRTRGFAPVKDRLAQIVIVVPGAAELVRDTIQIRSRMLKEQQTLEIVF